MAARRLLQGNVGKAVFAPGELQLWIAGDVYVPSSRLLRTVHLCCDSARPHREQGKAYVFTMVYHIGSYPAKQKLGRNVYPGWCFMSEASELANASEHEKEQSGWYDQTVWENRLFC